MLSTRQHLAFSCKYLPLISGRLGKLKSPPGAIPCQHGSVFERRHRSKYRRVFYLEDFNDSISTFDDHWAVKDILETYETAPEAPRWLRKQDVIDMMPYKPGNRRHHMKYLAKRESRLLQSKYETYHYHRHFNKKIPHFGCLFDESGQPVYGIYSNTIVSVVETVRNMDVRRNLVHASLFGHPLIVDFSYYHLMLSKQFSSLATQTHLVFARNCKTKHPFDLFFTSYSRGHRFEDFFVERSGGYSPDQLMITLREEPLEKLFPLEKLIYLSPHSPDVMTHFDPDAIYVLGALVDTYRTDKTENSFLRASAANIRSVRLPVTVKERNDRPPCLTISAVANMLIDMRNEGISVEEAMNRHLSIRKMRAPLNVVLRQQRKLELESTFSQQVDKLMTDCLSVH